MPNSNIYQKDFDFFVSTLKESHPNIKANLPDYDKVADELRAELATETDASAFEAKLRQFSHKLGDGHTGVWSHQGKKQKLYPISVGWFEQGWYVCGIDSLHADALGSRIVSINGRDADKVMSTLMSLVYGENIYWFRVRVDRMLQLAGNLKLLGLASEDSALHLELEKDGKQCNMSLQETESPEFMYPQRTGVTSYYCKPYWGKPLPEDSIFYLQFNEFGDAVGDKDKPFGDWIAFLDKSFATIDSLDLRNLVIDLRGNTGGNSTLGDILLTYCSLPDSIYFYSADVCICELYLKNYQVNMEEVMKSLAIERGITLEDVTLPYVIKSVGDKPVKANSEYLNYWKANNGEIAEPGEPKKPFDGKIILLIGGNTFSSAADFATICKDNGLAVIYGTPTGGQPSCYGDVLSFTLPNTGLKCGVSHKYFRRPDFSKDPEDALYPDVFLAQDPESYFKGKDILWERVLQDIRTDKVPEIPVR
jgi:hypothetical protein